MFTGIVEAVGKVVELGSSRLVVEATGASWSDGIQEGESIAVNGICLTAVTTDPSHLAFDLSLETINRTALKELGRNSSVNLERAMPATGRFGGHIVQGHVDGVGEVVEIRRDGENIIGVFQVPPTAEKYLVDKGSIAINGVSLTVVRPQGREFEVWLIPHTWNHTSFPELLPGSEVNLEYDVIAKYVEKMLSGVTPG